ncbi:MAG: hypothetical protein ACKVJF_03000 [Flavobacteriales bacterium]
MKITILEVNYTRSIFMCTLSNEIKLCSCGDKDLPSDNMWILRAKSVQNFDLVGEFFGHPEPESETEKWNYKMLLDKLNSKNLFDFDYVPKKGDELEIRICPDKESAAKLVFYFYFTKRWTTEMPMIFWKNRVSSIEG